MSEVEEFHVFGSSDEHRQLVEQLVRSARAVEPRKPVVHDISDISQVREYLVGAISHVLIGPRYATVSLPDDDFAGWHWKCSCGAETSVWIQNWPESEDEAREEWRLHFPDEDLD
jgi:hypothetical protein